MEKCLLDETIELIIESYNRRCKIYRYACLYLEDIFLKFLSECLIQIRYSAVINWWIHAMYDINTNMNRKRHPSDRLDMLCNARECEDEIYFLLV